MARSKIKVFVPLDYVKLWGESIGRFLRELADEVSGRFEISFNYYNSNIAVSFDGAKDALLVIPRGLFDSKIDMGRHNHGVNVRVLMPNGKIEDDLDASIIALEAVVARFRTNDLENYAEIFSEVIREIEGFFVTEAA